MTERILTHQNSHATPHVYVTEASPGNCVRNKSKETELWDRAEAHLPRWITFTALCPMASFEAGLAKSHLLREPHAALLE